MTDRTTAAVMTGTARYARRAARPASEGPAREALKPAEATAAGLLALFLAAMLMPVSFNIGSLNLSPVRVLLLVGFIPLAFRWLTGAAGRISVGDVFIGLHCLWIGLALFAVHGAERLPFAGITVVEVFGSYLLGRVLIRNVTDYRTFFRYFLIALAILAPFVMVELLTTRLILNDLLDPVTRTHPKVAAVQRMGLYRAQGVLEHPILWGTFCSVAIANTFYLYREPLAKGLMLTGFAIGMTFTGLSSGPLLAGVLQLGMIGWGWVTRNAWWTLVGLVVLAYVAIDLLSSRAPVQVLITYLTFNSHTAYWRLHIFNFGIEEVWRNPVFGIGLNDWERPGWMGTSSVDNFWLLTTMRYGIPAFLLLVAGIAANIVQIVRKELPDDLKDLRTGYVVAAVGISLTLCTVHVWGATAVLVMFYFGAGSWIFAQTLAAPVVAEAGDGRTPGAPSPRRGSVAESRGAPTKAERIARRRAQYSPPRNREGRAEGRSQRAVEDPVDA